MPLHPFSPPRGSLVHLDIESRALQDNLLGDPATRRVAVYLPPGYAEGDADYPLFVTLAGYTGSGYSHLNWGAYSESLPQRVERLSAEGRMGPVILAFPDCFTSLGGNQYVNSAAMGRWADYILQEMIPALEGRFRVRRGREHRAVFGKSSGGYGAIAHGLRYASHWGAIGCHSGDMAFDLVYWLDMAKTCDVIAKHDGLEGFFAHVDRSDKLSGGDFHALMMCGMAATYDPQPTAPRGVQLPVDLHTCELDADRWARWLEHDPVRMLDDPALADNLRSLRGIWIDCGRRDQYMLHYGARQLVAKLEALGIEHTYEEFDDNHSKINYRQDRSLPFLYQAVAR